MILLGRAGTMQAMRPIVVAALGLAIAAPGAVAGPAAPTIPAGVTIAGIPVAGLDRDDALTTVRRAVYEQPVVVTVDGQRRIVPAAAFRVSAVLQPAVDAALAATAPGDVVLEMRVPRGRLEAIARSLAETTSVPARNPRWRFTLRGPRIARGRSGLRADHLVLADAIEHALRAPLERGDVEASRAVTLPLRPDVAIAPAVWIDRDSKILRLVAASKRGKILIVRKFTVATGAPAYPTPRGVFSVIEKQRNPWWYPPDAPWAEGLDPVPPGPGNPLGTRWMGIGDGVGIHGTPDAASIGYSASHGCIRMLVPEAEWLFEHLSVGTEVLIT